MKDLRRRPFALQQSCGAAYTCRLVVDRRVAMAALQSRLGRCLAVQRILPVF
jgi:hypothetical protein